MVKKVCGCCALLLLFACLLLLTGSPGQAPGSRDLRWSSQQSTANGKFSGDCLWDLRGGVLKLTCPSTARPVNTDPWKQLMISGWDIKTISMVNIIGMTNGVTFQGYSTLETVDMSQSPDIVLCESMFKDCISLTTLSLPLGITTFPDRVLDRCFRLPSLSFPTTSKPYPLTTIGESAFRDCASLRVPFDPNRIRNLNSIGVSAFEDSGLTEMDLSLLYSKCEIGARAFAGCSSLKTFYQPGGEKMTTVPDSLFEGCTKLKTIMLDFYVTSIGSKAFSGCSACSGEFIVMGALESVGDFAFENSGFTSFDASRLSSKIQLGEGAFASCAALTQIKCSQETLAAVTELPRAVFKDCAKLQLSLPAFSSLTSIGFQALSGCLTLEEFVAPACLTSLDGDAFRQSSIVSFDASHVESTLTMGGGDFQECQNLLRVTLSPHVTELGSGEFRGCANLQTITNFPSLESIGRQAFSRCSSLVMDFTAPSTLASIADSAFEESAITSFDASHVASQLQLGPTVFQLCRMLVSVAFSQQSVTDLPHGIFYQCTSLERLSDLSSLESIGWSAFHLCSSLAIDFIAPESLAYIDARAFQNSAITSFDATNVKSTLEFGTDVFSYGSN